MATEDFSQEDGASIKSWKSISPIDETKENSSSGGFDCNICLDSVKDPVITMCGHLYCWPCIYKWIHVQTTSPENTDQQPPQCPVCKLEVSEKTIIPLYGPGLSEKTSTDEKTPSPGIVIPQRPPTPRYTPSSSRPRNIPQPQLTQSYPDSFRAAPTLNALGGGRHRSGVGPTGGTNVNPAVGMFGEMVYGRIFGNAETTVYSYPNSYNQPGSASPRIRRHIMEVDKSLSRLCIFLFCCLILCLVLF